MTRLSEHIEEATIRFAGDSGDGMQLVGTQFSETAGFAGNEVNTFPDYPAEIRAPEGTLYGVSAFQVHFGTRHIHTSGDQIDVLYRGELRPRLAGDRARAEREKARADALEARLRELGLAETTENE